MTNKRKLNLVAKEFNYELSYAGTKQTVNSAVIVIPNGLRYSDPDNSIRVITTDLVIYPEDENGDTINFHSVKEAQDWIDLYQDKIQFEVKNRDELHAIRNEFLIKEYYDTVLLTDNADNNWTVQGYTDGKSYYFTSDGLNQLNMNWKKDPSDDTYFIFKNYGEVILHDGLQDLELPVKEENGLYKFPERWNWIKVENKKDQESIFGEGASDQEKEIERIRELLSDYIYKTEGVCPGMVESTIASDNELVASLVNIRRMDNPKGFIEDYIEQAGFDLDKVSDLPNISSWSLSPIFDSDLQATSEAFKMGIIKGAYDFGEWEDVLYGIDDVSLRMALNEMADDGVIAKTDHNDKVLKDLGLKESDLAAVSIPDDELMKLGMYKQKEQSDIIPKTINIEGYIAEIGDDAVYDSDSSVVYFYKGEKNYDLGNVYEKRPMDKKGIVGSIEDYIRTTYPTSDSYRRFAHYCASKSSVLEDVLDNEGNSYQTLLKCKINDQPSSIVHIPEKENSLCWIDENHQLHIDDNNAPDIFAAKMDFEQIDQRYYDQLFIHWKGLMMDEQIALYESRDLVSENLSAGDDGPQFYVQL